MEVSTIAATNSAVAAQKATSVGFDDLSSEDFFGLLIAELQAQDPLDPQNNQQLLSQMSSIRQMEQSSALVQTLEALTGEQRFASTSGLIGHYIAGTVTDQAGNPFEVQGLVIGIRFERGEAIVELHNGRSLPTNKIEQVTLVENLPTEILEQLQQELGATAEGEAVVTSEGAVPAALTVDPAARSIFSDRPALKTPIANRARNLAEGVDVVAELLDSVFAPGIGIGF